MVEAAHVPETSVWVDAAHAPLVGDLLARMAGRVRPIAVGGPRSSDVRDLAGRLGLAAQDDLRKMLVDHPAAFVLLASGNGVAREDVASAVGHGAVVLAMEPVLAGLDDLAALPRAKGADPAAGVTARGRVVALPSFLDAPGWASAADPLEVLGDLRLIAMESMAPPTEGSCHARLHDAWQTVLTFVPMPETIDASVVGGPAGLPDSLRHLQGHVLAHARVDDRITVMVQVTTHAGPRRRRLTLLGEQGWLEVGEEGYDLRDPTGAVVDHRLAPPVVTDYRELLAGQWMRLTSQPDLVPASASAPAAQQVLACCLTCLLSARTRQAENPGNLMAPQRH